jgi:thiamine pyrophosphokinase
MSGRVVVVFANGPGRASPVSLPPGTAVIAADGGAEHALELGLAVDLVTGDLDSLAPSTLAALERDGVLIERHPVEKDASDLELALGEALELKPARIVVVAGGAGRLDHLLGGMLLLASDAFARVELDAQVGPAAVHVVRGERVLAGTPGELISLFAVNGPATGVITSGLVYALQGATLAPGSSLGLSNVFAESEARVSVERGVVLAVRPSGTVSAGS